MTKRPTPPKKTAKTAPKAAPEPAPEPALEAAPKTAPKAVKAAPAKRVAKPVPVSPPAAPPVEPRIPLPVPPKPRSAEGGDVVTDESGSPVAIPGIFDSGLDILMVTSEARPFAKTGGLADVCGALPLALARLGHRVTIVLPNYRGTHTDNPEVMQADVPFGLHSYPVRFLKQRLADGVTAVLVDAPALYDRDGLYGDGHGDYGDNAFRFAVLCRSALEYVRIRGARPSVIHAHDWQAGFAPVYARTVLRDDPIIGGVRTVLTIHNLAFQGTFDPSELSWIGLGRDLYTPDQLEFWGRGSSLKGGVVFSDKITTVSPTYAREIVTPEGGWGFNGILASRAADLIGIVNGIDTETWNPATDPYLPAHFDAQNLDGKADAKRALLEYADLRASLTRPVIGIVTRLTHQKGCDLVAAVADRLMGFDATWVMLGSGEAWCEDMWRGLAARYPGRVAARIGFDDRLAHLIEAGSDMFLMPSLYEPCGLNQMYSQRYGTVPIVRGTGGLNDTVVDSDEAPDRATGFKFRDYTPDAMVSAIGRALGAFPDWDRWKALQRNGMAQDFSWDVSAREYVKVYRGA
jgi:starch synthase